MNNVTNLDDQRPHITAELICVACYWRGVTVYPADLRTAELTCECGKLGTLIMNAEPLEDERI